MEEGPSSEIVEKKVSLEEINNKLDQIMNALSEIQREVTTQKT